MTTHRIGLRGAGSKAADDQKVDWTEIRAQLAKAGFPDTNVRRALIAFQKANHLSPARGTLDKKTGELLAMLSTQAPDEAQTGPVPQGWLARGSRGTLVKDLQREVGETPDGIYGPNTQRTVRAYNIKEGISRTGVAGTKTWQALGGDRFRAAPGAPPQPPATPEPAPVSPTAPEAETPAGDVPPERSIAMLGDSITANGGYGTDLATHLPGWRVANFGIVGNRTDQMNKRLGVVGGDVASKTVDLSQYKTLILLGGVNDIASGRLLGQIEESLRQLYDKADAQGVRVIPMTVSPWKGYPSWTPGRQATTDKLNDFIRAEAQRRGYPVVDLANTLSAKNDTPPGDRAALSAKYRGPGTEGLLHPGPAGQKEIGELIDRAAFEKAAPPQAPPVAPAVVDPGHPAALPDPATAPVAYFRALADANQTLKLNDRGAPVKVLQTALNSLNTTDAPLTPDGVYGRGTAAGVKTFALQATGIASDGKSLSPDALRALATQLERPGVIAAGFRLFNTFNTVSSPTGLHRAPIQEAANQLRQIAAAPDESSREAALHAWMDDIQKQADDVGPAKMTASDPTWQADIAALRAHFDEAAKVPGGLTAEVKVAQAQLAEANNQRIDAGMKLISQELLKQDPQTQQQFLGLLDALAAPDPGAPHSAAFQTARDNLSQFLLHHGGENKKTMPVAVREAWDELEATLLTARSATEASGNTQNAVKPFIDFLEEKYVSDTQALIKLDPKNPDVVNVPPALTERIAKLEAAADANPHPLVTAEMLQTLVTHAGYPPLTPAKAQAMAAGLQSSMELAQITTAHERAAFLAQCVVETGGLRTFEEEDGGNPAYFDRYDNNKGLGNLGHPDGQTFHGRGPVQLTGRDNYTRFSAWMKDGNQVIKSPDIVATDPKYSFASAGWFWNVNHLNDPANQGNLRLVVQRLNGPGMLGWDKRVAVYNDALGEYAKQGAS